jgi:hypothetical protein
LALALSEVLLNNEQRNKLAEALDRMPRGPSRETIDDFIKDTADGSEQLERFMSWMNLMKFDCIKPGMPLQDGIDLAVWLVETTIGRYRFTHTYPLAGGPIDIAVITHAKFTWIQRKSWHGYEKKPIQL